MKAAIAILSHPKSGGEEALGRLFNGLAAAYDFKERGTEVAIYFQGTGTRWVGEVGKPEHPVHAPSPIRRTHADAGVRVDVVPERIGFVAFLGRHVDQD